eukprot:11200007-Lingulodinium_polyedra.AAC.1
MPRAVVRRNPGREPLLVPHLGGGVLRTLLAALTAALARTPFTAIEASPCFSEVLGEQGLGVRDDAVD